MSFLIDCRLSKGNCIFCIFFNFQGSWLSFCAFSLLANWEIARGSVAYREVRIGSDRSWAESEESGAAYFEDFITHCRLWGSITVNLGSKATQQQLEELNELNALPAARQIPRYVRVRVTTGAGRTRSRSRSIITLNASLKCKLFKWSSCRKKCLRKIRESERERGRIY